MMPMAQKMWPMALLFLLLVLGIEANAGSEPACPPWATHDKPILQHSFTWRTSQDRGYRPIGLGPQLDSTSYYWTRGVWFEVPFGYHNPWAKGEYAYDIIDLERYKATLARSSSKGFDPKTEKFNPDLITRGRLQSGFAFWMPSLRYVERDLWRVAYQRPCEAGRRPPTENEYTVFFTIDWPFLADSGMSSVARRFRIAAERLQTEGKLPSQDRPHIEHSLNGPITGAKSYKIYDDDGDLVAQLRCTPFIGSDMPPNPGCGGHVWRRSKNLILYVRFPADQGQFENDQRWRIPVNAAIQLAEKWRR